MPLSFKDVASIANDLPDVTIGTKWGHKTWLVGDRGFIWERPLGKADIKRLGDTPAPQGDILGVRVENLDAKDALLAIAPPGFFTIEHFNNYAAVLVELRLAQARDVKAALRDAHRVMARAKPRKKKPPAKRVKRTP